MTLGVKILIYGILILGCLIVYVRFLEATTVFLPAKKVVVSPQNIRLDYEDINLVTPDQVKINGWFVRAAPGQTIRPTFLFLHGNAGNIGDRLDKIALFHGMGANVMIIDYRGYGKSQGSPTEKGMYLDTLAAFDYLLTRKDVAPDKIIVYGESLGGAAAVDLATRRPVSGLILDSTFTSAAEMGKLIFPIAPSFLLSLKMDSLSKIKKISIPKFFIHSPSDETIPFAIGKKLFMAAPEPKEFLETEGGHNDGYAVSQKIFVERIKNFLKKYGFSGV